jgi:hypothetical protein
VERTACEGSESDSDPTFQVTPRIELEASPESPDFGTVSVKDLSTECLLPLEEIPNGSVVWRQLFAVYTGAICPPPEEQQSVLGSYELEADSIRFRPRFPFVVGLHYCARFDPKTLGARAFKTCIRGETLEATFALPQPPERKESPTVEAIYPSSQHVPANLLRLYIHFSTPMRSKDIDKLIHLFDAAGEEVLLPFVEIPQGLWDPSGTRLTLFFHPGRVKRGVGPNISMGAPLREGTNYRLVVGAGLQNIDGVALGDDFEHVFVVGAEDRKSPDPDRWLIEAPGGATADLVVSFPEPLDRALLHRMIWVLDGKGNILDGTITVGEEETRWLFQPSTPWVGGDYVIEVDPALEDLAGNAIGHLFEKETGIQGVSEPGEPGEPSEASDAADASADRQVSMIPFRVQ